jgi:hypothetical protein
MKTEQQQLSDMYARVKQVFSQEEFESLAQQQRTLLDNAIQRVADKEGLEALTVPRLEGIKELVTQHLWSPALSEASKSSPGSAMETSKTSDSTPPKSSASAPDSQASSEATAPPDLQNLPEDPALGAIKAMQSRLQGQSTTDDKED